MDRRLPIRSNPYLATAASYENLVNRRSLGRARVAVSPGLAGICNATQKYNLGRFDYAFLHVPLPPSSELEHSEIFKTKSRAASISYALLRRSSDGYVSATYLYKAAFPWSTLEEEKQERAYVKSLPETHEQEVAGSVWINPETALRLATEYHISTYVCALLDPAPIELGRTISPTEKAITAPPTFDMARHHDKSANGMEPTPKSSRKDRSLRSVSPSKLPAPSPDTRPKASPKRRLKGKKEKKGPDSVRAKSRALNDHVEDATPSIADSAAETEEPDDEKEDTLHAVANHAAEAVAAETEADAEDAIAAIANDVHVKQSSKPQTKITVTTDEQDDGTVDAKRTKVTVEMPAGAGAVDVPADAEEAIAAAKAIVEEAKALQDGQVDTAPPSKAGRKRKADELEVENPEEELVTEWVNGEGEATDNGEGSSADAGKHIHFGERDGEPATKRTRVMVPAEEYRREKMQRRALLGVTATFAVGAIIPFVSNLF